MAQEIFPPFSFFNFQSLDAYDIFLTHTHTHTHKHTHTHRQYFFVRARVS
jgi:hypothetical protein